MYADAAELDQILWIQRRNGVLKAMVGFLFVWFAVAATTVAFLPTFRTPGLVILALTAGQILAALDAAALSLYLLYHQITNPRLSILGKTAWIVVSWATGIGGVIYLMQEVFGETGYEGV